MSDTFIYGRWTDLLGWEAARQTRRRESVQHHAQVEHARQGLPWWTWRCTCGEIMTAYGSWREAYGDALTHVETFTKTEVHVAKNDHEQGQYPIGEPADKATGRRGVSQKNIGQKIPKDKLPKEKGK
jgi:hypothetical protein